MATLDMCVLRYKKTSYIAVVFVLCAVAFGIGFRLMLGKARLQPAGHLGDNINFAITDAGLYQILILCLSVLIAPFLPGFIRKAARRIINTKSAVFLTAIALFVFLIANLISYLVLEHFPRDVDNVARLFQARTFASGRLYVEAPAVPNAFSVANVVIKDGRIYSKYAPGSSLVYALWLFILRIHWGVNPFLGALMLIILYYTFRMWYDEQTVRLTLILLCLSPFFIFMTSSFHSHLPCLFFLSAFLLCLSLGFRTGKWHQFILAGLWLGMAFITRPYTALLISLPFLAWCFIRRGFREMIRRLLLLSVGFAIPLGFLLYYNNALTGHPLRFPFLVANPDEKIGFGHIGHTPLRGVKNTLEMLSLLKLNLFGWPCCFLFAVLLIFLGKKHKWDVIALAGVLCLIVGYGFYHWIDFSFGPRFYFEMLPLLVLLCARGMTKFPEYIRKRGIRGICLESFVYWFVMISFLFAFVFYIPPLTRMYHRDYNQIVNTRVASLAGENQIHNALVFMRDLEGYNFYASGFLANSLDFQGDVVYAIDGGQEQNQSVISAYPGRDVFFFEFDRSQRTGKFTRLSDLSMKKQKGYTKWPS